jgi:hypothetical protein
VGRFSCLTALRMAVRQGAGRQGGKGGADLERQPRHMGVAVGIGRSGERNAENAITLPGSKERVCYQPRAYIVYPTVG